MKSIKFDIVREIWIKVYGNDCFISSQVLICPECKSLLNKKDWPEFTVDDTVDIKDGVQVFCPVCQMSL